MNTPIPNAARILGQTGVLRADDGGRRRIGRCGGPTDVSYPLLRTPSICPLQNNKMQKSPERHHSRLLCLYVYVIYVRGGYCQGK